MKREPFQMVGAESATGLSAVAHRLMRAVERPLALTCLRRKYAAAIRNQDLPFAESALDVMNVGFECDDEELARIPADGPVVVVANHPFGMIEGLGLLALMRRRRTDGRLLGNYLLSTFPELADDLILVDPYDRSASKKQNLAPIRDSIRWVRKGRMIGIFPAGEVARRSWGRRGINEAPWSDTVVKLIRRTGATTVPIWFEGANSRIFHLLGMLHPRIRTALLVRELVNKEGKTIRARVGTPIPASRLESFSESQHQTSYLRMRTISLAGEGRLPKAPLMDESEMVPIADPTPPETIRREVEALPREQVLLSTGDTDVIYARAHHIPETLLEIGRLREVTFRPAHEGTGLARDLSSFDQTYIHLFLYRPETAEIIGAYRMGPTEEILPESGVRGLYTSTLFRISNRLLEEIGPGLEMGRSFVRPEYQRSYAPLLLLWKGIGHYVAKYPDAPTLFGPVSINNDYHSVSRELLVAFLRRHGYWSELSRLVRPRMPLKPRRAGNWDARNFSSVIRDIEDMSTLISEIEWDGKGVPVLLRQYLKLGAHLLGFNVDPAFGHALDGLIVTDLRRTDPRILGRYMGRKETKEFHRYHAEKDRAADTSPELVT